MNKGIIGVLLAVLMCMASVAPAIAIDWQQFHNDVANIGTTASDAPDDNNLLWTSDIIDAVGSSSTVVAEDKVFVYCNGALKALDISNGAEMWTVPIPTSGLGSWHSPSYHDGCVFITAGTDVYCRHASNGFEKWTWAIPSGHESCNGGTTVADGKVVVGDWDAGNYYCIDEATGTNLLWTFVAGGYAQGTPAYANGNFYLTSWAYPGGHIYSVDAATGIENWNQTTPLDTCGSAAVADGLVYVTNYNFYGLGAIYALYETDGVIKWSNTTIMRTDSTPAVADGYVYVSSGCDGYSDLQTYCFNAEDGTFVWETDPADEIGGWTCSPAVADGKVFVGEINWMDYIEMYALDTATGEVEWTASSQGGASPAIADGIVFTIGGGKVYAYGTVEEVAPPVTPFAISGETLDNASVELNDCTVTIENLNTGASWDAVTSETENFYLLLVTSDDVSDGDSLRITAKNTLEGGYTTPENYTYCINISTVDVTQDDVDMGGLAELDIILDHFCINYYPEYPYFTQNAWNYSGAAVMKMWTDFKDEGPYTQDDLQTWGLANNRVDSDPYCIDPQGMAQTLNDLLPEHFTVGVHDNTTEGLNHALHRICWWQYLGPGSLPTMGNPAGNYEFWMGIRGIHTDKNPHEGTYSAPYGYDVYGFWVNDPNTFTGIGENSYKTATEWTENYYLPTNDPRIADWDDKYITVLEPPEDDTEITIVPSKPRLAKAITPVMMEKTLKVDGIERLTLVEVVEDEDALDVVKAAIDGVSEELIPYDPQFADVFAETVAGEPMLVASDNGDYYLVPFNVPVEVKQSKKVPVAIEKVKISGEKKLERVKRVDAEVIIEPIPIEPIKLERTLVVVLVDAEDGSFKEASWVSDPVDYLPVSKVEALKLVFEKTGIPTTKPVIELVQRDSSAYYPDWKITIDDSVFYVGQDGMVTSNMPEPTPVPVKKVIDETAVLVE